MKTYFAAVLMLLAALLWAAQTKPPAGSPLDPSGAYYSGLTYVYPINSLTDTELVSGASTTAAGSATPIAATSTAFGSGFANDETANKNINTGLTAGFAKNLSRCAFVACVRTGASLPAAGTFHFYLQDAVADVSGTTRLALVVAKDNVTWGTQPGRNGWLDFARAFPRQHCGQLRRGLAVRPCRLTQIT